jgi:hypothetical protein
MGGSCAFRKRLLQRLLHRRRRALTFGQGGDTTRAGLGLVFRLGHVLGIGGRRRLILGRVTCCGIERQRGGLGRLALQRHADEAVALDLARTLRVVAGGRIGIGQHRRQGDEGARAAGAGTGLRRQTRLHRLRHQPGMDGDCDQAVDETAHETTTTTSARTTAARRTTHTHIPHPPVHARTGYDESGSYTEPACSGMRAVTINAAAHRCAQPVDKCVAAAC